MIEAYLCDRPLTPAKPTFVTQQIFGQYEKPVKN
jgi:hypothetical protein